jgi:hypothetical protein
MKRVGDATRPQVQTEPVAQERCDLAGRQPQVFIEQHDQGDRVRPQMRARGAERVRALQRMPALHPAPTIAAAADMDIEPTHVRADDRQIFLELA